MEYVLSFPEPAAVLASSPHQSASRRGLHVELLARRRTSRLNEREDHRRCADHVSSVPVIIDHYHRQEAGRRQLLAVHDVR